MPVSFFVVTRLGIGVHSEAWFDSMLGLFEAVTFPSLCAQSDAEFIALIVVDQGMPAGARARLSEIVNGRDNFHVVSIDLTTAQSVRQGGFDYVWDACQDYLLGRGVIANPLDYAVTSLLDAGDAWHRSTVALVRDQVEADLPEFLIAEQQNLSWIKHSGGLYLSFPDGLEWYVQSDVVLPIRRPYQSASTFVAARLSSGISACSCRPNAWPSYCNVLGFRVIAPEASKPMWVHVHHDRSDRSWELPGKASDVESASALQGQFGIHSDKVAIWKKNNIVPAKADNDDRHHEGLPGTEQLDCGVRISALNRQIAALERQLKAGSLFPEGKELLARQCHVRAELERLYRERAQSEFS